MKTENLLKEARDLLVMCQLLDKSGQCTDMVDRIDIAIASQQQEGQTVSEFPTWQEAIDGITDSRIKAFKDMNIYRAGARIMYDRLYIMLKQSTLPTAKERYDKAKKHWDMWLPVMY